MRGGRVYTAKLRNRMYKTNVIANLPRGNYITTVNNKYTYKMHTVPPSKKQGGRRTRKNRSKRSHRMKR